jgi:hypothetical protein
MSAYEMLPSGRTAKPESSGFNVDWPGDRLTDNRTRQRCFYSWERQGLRMVDLVVQLNGQGRWVFAISLAYW